MTTLDRLVPPAVLPGEGSTWSPRRAIAVTLVLLAAIALVQVLLSSRFAHTGQTLERLEQQRTGLRASIHQLEAEVAALSSLDRTERAARDRLGMVPPMKTDYLSVNVAAPATPLFPRAFLEPEAASTQTDQDSWWQSVVRALPVP